MISSVFQEAKKKNKTVFIPYYPAGYPSINASKKVFAELSKSGADLLEVGFPFSDPLADGPTIQKASKVALDAGFKVNKAFNMLRGLGGEILPTIIMTYYNLLYRNGLKNFARKAAKSGVKGIIIPDLPIEEAKEWLSVSRDHIDTIFLVAPTSSDRRIKMISSATNSFIYCVSITGVTGARTEVLPNTLSFLKRVRKNAKKPIAVGFGISTKEHVNKIKPYADGVIVGSAIIKAYDNGKNVNDGIKSLNSYIKEITA